MRTGAWPRILLSRKVIPLVREVLDPWTSQKLAALHHYLSAFAREAQEWGYSPAYIDVFTCADYGAAGDSDATRLSGFPGLATDGPKALLKHAVRTALTTQPSFDGFMFIERDRRRRHLLEAVKHEFRQRNVQIRRCEVNREIERITRLDWHMRRAVLFVDAYAGSLEWNTVLAISRAQVIDLWLLLPVGFHSGQPASCCVVPRAWRERVSQLLDNRDWFSECESRRFEHYVATLNRCVEDKLRASFAHVAAPLVVRSQSGAPLYALHFASNMSGSEESRRSVTLATHLLDAIGG